MYMFTRGGTLATLEFWTIDQASAIIISRPLGRPSTGLSSSFCTAPEDLPEFVKLVKSSHNMEGVTSVLYCSIIYPPEIQHSHQTWSIYRWLMYQNWRFSVATSMLNDQRVSSPIQSIMQHFPHRVAQFCPGVPQSCKNMHDPHLEHLALMDNNEN